MANGVPHFVKGVTGESHATPFRRPSSALLNVVWGTANFFLAGWLWLFASFQAHALGFALVAFFLGILAAGIRLSKLWERRLDIDPRNQLTYT